MLNRLFRKAPRSSQADTAQAGLDVPVATLNQLQQWQLSRQLLLVDDGRGSAPRQTIILAIDVARQVVLLDDFHPAASVEEQPVEGDQISLRVRHGNDWLEWHSPILLKDREDGSPFYGVRLPPLLDRVPRRGHPRRQIEPATLLAAKVISPLRSPWFAAVRDLSEGGIGLIVGGNALDQLIPGSVIPSCRLQLSDGLFIEQPLLVRHYRFVRSPLRQTEIGCQWMNLKAELREPLRQFIEQPASRPTVAA